MNFKKIFTKVNESRRQKMIFRVGCNGGLFSEINCMIFAILYCLEHKLKFELTDVNANFADWSEKPWEEFFIPFLKINRDKIHAKYNQRWKVAFDRKYDFLHLAFYKFMHNVKYFTQDIIDEIVIYYAKEKIVIPELGGGMEGYMHKSVAEMVWQFKPQVQQELNEVMAKIGLPSRYVSIQLRRGDKVTLESQICPPAEKFMEHLRKISPCKDVLLLCDDYKDVKYLRSNYPDYNFYTICQPDEQGYMNDQFYASKKEVKRRKIVDLLSTVDHIIRGELFIGTRVANPSIFIKMIMPKEKFFFIEDLLQKSKLD